MCVELLLLLCKLLLHAFERFARKRIAIAHLKAKVTKLRRNDVISISDYEPLMQIVVREPSVLLVSMMSLQ
jgi:hypothetical protein